jgi:hypothetical protein
MCSNDGDRRGGSGGERGAEALGSAAAPQTSCHECSVGPLAPAPEDF